MNKKELFKVDESERIMSVEEKENKLMQYFVVDNFVDKLFSKKKLVEYLQEWFNVGIDNDDIIELVKKIDTLELKNIGSIYVSEQEDKSIVLYFYVDDSSIILKRK